MIQISNARIILIVLFLKPGHDDLWVRKRGDIDPRAAVRPHFRAKRVNRGKLRHRFPSICHPNHLLRRPSRILETAVGSVANVGLVSHLKSAPSIKSSLILNSSYISLGMFMMGCGSLVFFLPHFITGQYLPTNVVSESESGDGGAQGCDRTSSTSFK